MAYETWIGGRVAIRSWARREADPSPRGRAITAWQEVDLSALNRPGGRMRLVTRIRTRPDLAPRRITIDSAVGRAEMRFVQSEVRIRLVDGTRLTKATEPIDLALPDNIPALFALYLRILGDTERLPGTFTAYLPGTLATMPLTIEASGSDLLTSLGDEIRLDADGLVERIMVDGSGSVRVERTRTPVPRWRQLAPSRARGAHRARKWGPARDFSSLLEGRRHWARISSIARPRGVMLLLGGSGIHDRLGYSGDVALGYGELAAMLTRGGIQCLTYDKPGAGRTRVDPSSDRPSFDRVIALAAHWLDELRSRTPPGVPLVVAGHSQGGQVAAALAARRSDIAGLALLATAARQIDEILYEQIRLEGKDLGIELEEQEKRIANLRDFFAWRRSSDLGEIPPERHVALSPWADWYGGLIATSLDRTLPLVRVPVAVLHGDRDIQVPCEEAERLARLVQRAPVSVRVFRGLDHLFKPAASATNIRAYGDHRRRVSRAVGTWLLDWFDTMSAGVGDQEGRADDGGGQPREQRPLFVGDKPD